MVFCHGLLLTIPQAVYEKGFFFPFKIWVLTYILMTQRLKVTTFMICLRGGKFTDPPDIFRAIDSLDIWHGPHGRVGLMIYPAKDSRILFSGITTVSIVRDYTNISKVVVHTEKMGRPILDLCLSFYNPPFIMVVSLPKIHGWIGVVKWELNYRVYRVFSCVWSPTLQPCIWGFP